MFIQYKGATYKAAAEFGAVAARQWAYALSAYEDIYNDSVGGTKKALELYDVRTFLSNVVRIKTKSLSSKDIADTKKAVETIFSPALDKVIAKARKNTKPEYMKYLDKRVKIVLDAVKKLKGKKAALFKFLDEASAQGKASVAEAQKQVLALVKSIRAPEGFTLETKKVVPDKIAQALPYIEVTLKKEGEIEIKMEFTLSNHARAEWDKNLGSGHTRFKTEKGWLTYDRIGVSDSFYIDIGDDINKKIAEQLEKIKVSLEKHKTTQAVPGLGFLLTPETIEKHKKTLSEGGVVSLAPSGFGTGYHLSTRQRPGSHEGSSELAKFFGVDKIFMTEFDHD
jgi:hypothetical protein